MLRSFTVVKWVADQSKGKQKIENRQQAHEVWSGNGIEAGASTIWSMQRFSSVAKHSIQHTLLEPLISG